MTLWQFNFYFTAESDDPDEFDRFHDAAVDLAEELGMNFEGSVVGPVDEMPEVPAA